MYSYRDLDVYKNAKKLVKEVYALLSTYPKEEQFALCDQLRRAVTSVPINIAEGLGRFSMKEQSYFLEIAYGSLAEVQCELDLSCDLGYITIDNLTQMEGDIAVVMKQLYNLRKKIKEKQ